MKILHDKNIEENEHFQISYSVFCRLRPFWTVAPTEKDRETCLCKICENGRYLAECLKNYNVLRHKQFVRALQKGCVQYFE